MRIIYCICLFSCLSLHANAEQSRLNENGTSRSSVLHEKGEPIEKIEREVRRVEIWKYSDGQVIFKDGVAAAYNKPDLILYNSKNSVSQSKTEKAPPIKSGYISQDVFTDILRSIPSDSSTETGPSKAGPITPPRFMQPTE